MNQNANFAVSLSSATGTTTYYDSGDGIYNQVNLVPPNLYVNGFGPSTNVGSTRVTYAWTGANATATTNQQQLSGFSPTNTTVSTPWYCTITDTKSGIILTSPTFTQTYTAPAAKITKSLFSSANPQPLGNEYYNISVAAYNITPTAYSWTFVTNTSGSTIVGPTLASTRTNSTERYGRSGAIDVVRCTVTYSGGTINATVQLVWPVDPGGGPI
jgi:hypothetical protein